MFPETKSSGIFINIHEPEANNCFSIITQVITEITIKQRNIKFYHNLQKFLKGKSEAYKKLICIIQNVHFQVGVGGFNCQQILTKISLVIFNVVVKNKSNVVYRGLYSYRQRYRSSQQSRFVVKPLIYSCVST